MEVQLSKSKKRRLRAAAASSASTTQDTLLEPVGKKRKVLGGNDRASTGEKQKGNGQREDLFSVSTFSEFNLFANLMSGLEELHYEKPTKIQQEAIPPMLLGKDVLMKAETGSGKTLAYLIPMIQELATSEPRIDRSSGTYAVIIVPTRELADQVVEVAHHLTHFCHWLVCGAIRGGEKRKSEKARLRKGVTILIATPGRLLDHLKHTESFKFEHLRWLVLDEADRLLDMGFEKDITSIIRTFQSKRLQDERPLQSVLCSATLPQQVTRLAGVSLRNPVRIEIAPGSSLPAQQGKAEVRETTFGREEDASDGEEQSNEDQTGEEDGEEEVFQIPKQLKQFYVQIPCKRRLVALAAFLRWKASTVPNCKIIIFVSTTNSVDFHATLFGRTMLPDKLDITEAQGSQPLLPIPIYKLHGNLTQLERTKVYTAFNKASSGILICTDVAARGVDFPNITWIVQYDPPVQFADYIHRVGRTARIGNVGNSLLFVLPSEYAYVELLKQHGVELKEQPLEPILEKLDSQGVKVEGCVALQWRFESMVEKDQKELAAKARQTFLSFTRAYNTHCKETRHIFNIKNLHLGHLAKTFALKEAPSQVVMKGKRVDVHFDDQHTASRIEKQNSRAKQVSEMSIPSEFLAF